MLIESGITKRERAAVNTRAHTLAAEVELAVKKRLLSEARDLPEGIDLDRWLAQWEVVVDVRHADLPI